MRYQWTNFIKWLNKPKKLSEKTEKKFLESIRVEDWEVLTEDGYKPIYSSNQTIEYEVYILHFENGYKLGCADNHILIDHQGDEVFSKDALGKYFRSDDLRFDFVQCIRVERTDKKEIMYDLTVNSKDHTYYTNGILSHNSITTLAWLLHYALFNSDKTIAILANKGATAREMLGRITLMLENIPFFMQPGCKELNKGSIHFSNNSKIIAASTSSSSIRGFAINCLYLDEFAFVPNADVFYTSTYPVISSGDSTKIIITSTPNGMGNLFHRIWERAVEGANEFNPIRIHWWDVPGRDEKWKNETIANTSELQFRQEFGTEFLGTENNLISYESLMKLKAKDPISYFENGSVKIYKEPIDGHNYIMTVDVSSGVGKDYSAFTIIDITQKPFEQVAVFRNNRVPSILLSTFLYKYATSYNKAIVIIESNDEGKTVCTSLYHEFEYENTYMESSKSLGVRMTRSVKRIGCATIKELVESGKIDIVDENAIYEMTCFESDGFSYQASRGNNDDLMMNLVLFAYYTTTNSFSEISQSNIKTILYEDQINKIFDDILPFGYIEDGLNKGFQKNPWSLVDDYY